MVDQVAAEEVAGRGKGFDGFEVGEVENSSCEVRFVSGGVASEELDDVWVEVHRRHLSPSLGQRDSG